MPRSAPAGGRLAAATDQVPAPSVAGIIVAEVLHVLVVLVQNLPSLARRSEMETAEMPVFRKAMKPVSSITTMVSEMPSDNCIRPARPGATRTQVASYQLDIIRPLNAAVLLGCVPK